MATIRPFKAYRPCETMASKIAALPYDVYNRTEAACVVKANPDSFLAIDRAETSFPADVDTYDARVYDKARELLDLWISEGKFIQDDSPCYYIYEQVMDGRSQKGIVACASIDDYVGNVIKKHENTRADKELDRIRHVDICSAQTGPIFLAYRSCDRINEIVAEVISRRAVYDFTSEDGIIHRVWIVNSEEKVAELQQLFEKMDAIYIADGHHRCASAVKVGMKRREENPSYTGAEEFNYFLSVLFPSEELAIMDYNRVVKDLNGFSSEEFMERISEDFVVSFKDSQVKPQKKGQFGMFLEGKWYLLEAKDALKSDDAVKGLDVSILQDYLLGPVLGIGDPKTDKRIDFVGGIRGLSELEKRVSSDMKVAFSMYPTTIYELFGVADAGLLMPPKSTWFEPKLRSGLFIHKI
ncbi:MAG: DUF1015 domain-containing protein [Lachnospiraceae bacterium]|nr:DUF1015 domain-containing protein [Lachnospiraceae bacterium]